MHDDRLPAAGETAAEAQEELEAWIMEEVEKGTALPGLYPPNAENKARFEQARAQKPRRSN